MNGKGSFIQAGGQATVTQEIQKVIPKGNYVVEMSLQVDPKAFPVTEKCPLVIE